MKIPVIASDIPGCNEIISHQSNGILVKSKSINELFLSMISSIKNVSIFQKYANQGERQLLRNIVMMLFRNKLSKLIVN